MKNNLQKLRWEKGWSQSKLALYSGLTREMISMIESGHRPNPSVFTALKLAHALKVSVEDIFTLF